MIFSAEPRLSNRNTKLAPVAPKPSLGYGNRNVLLL